MSLALVNMQSFTKENRFRKKRPYLLNNIIANLLQQDRQMIRGVVKLGVVPNQANCMHHGWHNGKQFIEITDTTKLFHKRFECAKVFVDVGGFFEGCLFLN